MFFLLYFSDIPFYTLAIVYIWVAIGTVRFVGINFDYWKKIEDEIIQDEFADAVSVNNELTAKSSHKLVVQREQNFCAPRNWCAKISDCRFKMEFFCPGNTRLTCDYCTDETNPHPVYYV